MTLTEQTASLAAVQSLSLLILKTKIMEIEKAQKASKLLSEIENLSKYKEFLSKKETHVELHQGFEQDSECILIPNLYNHFFIAAIERAISHWENEISNL